MSRPARVVTHYEDAYAGRTSILSDGKWDVTRRHGTDWIKTSYPQGRCQDCDKLYYSSRGNAKQNLKRLRHHGKQHVYECPTHEGWWHVGHLPEAVVRGEHGREELVHGRKRQTGEEH